MSKRVKRPPPTFYEVFTNHALEQQLKRLSRVAMLTLLVK